jgi:hypothetical protein
MLLPLLLLACSSSDGSDDSGAPPDTGSEPVLEVCDPVAPTCIDDMILDLSLHDDKTNNGAVETSTDGDDFVTTADAYAGGSSNASNRAWVYFRFDEDGATKIETDDESALERTDWHVAVRRFIVRLNSGDSGPSCVAASEQRGTYEDLTAVPDDARFRTEDFYDDSCTLQEDDSGLPGSPEVALGAWWTYGSTLEPTLVPFLVQVEDGRVLKLVIEEYDDGFYTMRWRWLE